MINKISGTTIIDLNLYYKATVTKIAYYWLVWKQTPWSMTKKWGFKHEHILLLIPGFFLLFLLKGQKYTLAKDSRQHLQPTKGSWSDWVATCKRMKLDPYFSLCTKQGWIRWAIKRIQMDQGVQHQIWNPELDRRESKEYIYMHWHRRRLSNRALITQTWRPKFQ